MRKTTNKKVIEAAKNYIALKERQSKIEKDIDAARQILLKSLDEDNALQADKFLILREFQNRTALDRIGLQEKLGDEYRQFEKQTRVAHLRVRSVQ